MRIGKFNTAIFMFVLLLCALTVTAQQGADNKPFSPTPDAEQPKSFREMMQKMRIEQEKKDYEEMLDRAQQALKISEQLEQSFAQRQTLSQSEREKLDNLEKLVKKVRGELGGEDGDKDAGELVDDDPAPGSAADGLKTLQSLTSKLVDELKKTSRFGISAVAIQSTNAVLKVVRFLRFPK